MKADENADQSGDPTSTAKLANRRSEDVGVLYNGHVLFRPSLNASDALVHNSSNRPWCATVRSSNGKFQGGKDPFQVRNMIFDGSYPGQEGQQAPYSPMRGGNDGRGRAAGDSNRASGTGGGGRRTPRSRSAEPGNLRGGAKTNDSPSATKKKQTKKNAPVVESWYGSKKRRGSVIKKRGQQSFQTPEERTAMGTVKAMSLAEVKKHFRQKELKPYLKKAVKVAKASVSNKVKAESGRSLPWSPAELQKNMSEHFDAPSDAKSATVAARPAKKLAFGRRLTVSGRHQWAFTHQNMQAAHVTHHRVMPGASGIGEDTDTDTDSDSDSDDSESEEEDGDAGAVASAAAGVSGQETKHGAGGGATAAASAATQKKLRREGKKRRKAERELAVLRKDLLEMRFSLEDAKSQKEDVEKKAQEGAVATSLLVQAKVSLEAAVRQESALQGVAAAGGHAGGDVKQVLSSALQEVKAAERRQEQLERELAAKAGSLHKATGAAIEAEAKAQEAVTEKEMMERAWIDKANLLQKDVEQANEAVAQVMTDAEQSQRRLLGERERVAAQARTDLEVLRLQMREALAQTNAERDLLKIQLKRNESHWANASIKEREAHEAQVEQVRAAGWCLEEWPFMCILRGG
jgi:hypothetical protein